MILCGPVRTDRLPFKGSRPLPLSLWEPGRNIHLRIEDVRQAMCADVPPAFRDLIDIAA
jgi:hypothetical protein